MAAGREKDFDFVNAMFAAGLIDRELLKTRVALLPIAPPHMEKLRDGLAQV
jgi:hypothetical protein